MNKTTNEELLKLLAEHVKQSKDFPKVSIYDFLFKGIKTER